MSVEPHESPPRGEGSPRARRRREKHRCPVHGSARSANRRRRRRAARSLRHSPRQRHTCSPAKLFLSLPPGRLGGQGSHRGEERGESRSERAFYTATRIFIQIIVAIEHTLALPDDVATMRCDRINVVDARSARVAPITRPVNRSRSTIFRPRLRSQVDLDMGESSGSSLGESRARERASERTRTVILYKPLIKLSNRMPNAVRLVSGSDDPSRSPLHY